MQGFNRYIPPDFDPKKTSTLNSYQGKKHALGNRAKDIDKGVLVVRFELPFNIWCGTCNNHIGAGVRYNAQKRKVGNYYSTPIFAFRCKCHLCSGWFEIRTDPQNARYVVEEGARQQEADWDPEENGGHAVFDTEAPSASIAAGEPGSVDAIVALEKDTDQQESNSARAARIAELAEASDRLGADPWLANRKLRAKFRDEKKIMLEKQDRDEGVLERYALHQLELGEEDVDKSHERWVASRENRGLETEATKKGSVQDLGKRIRQNTAKKFDVFDVEAPLPRKRRVLASREDDRPAPAPVVPPPEPAGLPALLAEYGSDSE